MTQDCHGRFNRNKRQGPIFGSPPPGDFPDPGIEPGFPALQADYRLSYQESSVKSISYGETVAFLSREFMDLENNR